MAAFSEYFLTEGDFKAALALFYCYDYMVPTFLRKLRRSLQIKNIITNPPWALTQIILPSITVKKG